MSKLLPNDFEQLIKKAVKQFWTSRNQSSTASQGGSRASVIGGKNLDGFTEVVRAVAKHCGLEDDCIIVEGKKNLTIPGFFRPTKMWDAIILYRGSLIAGFELKSQVGSFGNNFNNRSEESIGSAKDFWTAYREKAFELSNQTKHSGEFSRGDFKPPFLGYLMLLEDCDGSTTPVKVEEAHFKVFPEFINSSYARRYQLLCEKLVIEGLYSSASLVLSNKESGNRNGDFFSPADSLTPKSLFADFAARLLAAVELK